MNDTFKIKYIGPLKFFLGLEVARSLTCISVCQRNYVLELLTEFGYLDSKPVSTPIDCSSQSLKNANMEPFLDIPLYKRLVGKLLYLTITRPDLSFVVQQLSQHPATPHFNYTFQPSGFSDIKKDLLVLVSFPSKSDMLLKAYSDAYWASCQVSRRSISDYCIFLSNALVGNPKSN